MRAVPRITVRDLQSRLRIDGRHARRIASAVVSGEGGKTGEITVCFVSDRVIRKLNRDFHGRDLATDVLAFNIGTPEEFLADIVISTDTAFANAAEFHTRPLYESYLYLIHGILHLFGYDDLTPKKRAAMRRKEAYYLRTLKIKPTPAVPQRVATVATRCGTA
jgi:probable rRNA maturation factor